MFLGLVCTSCNHLILPRLLSIVIIHVNDASPDIGSWELSVTTASLGKLSSLCLLKIA